MLQDLGSDHLPILLSVRLSPVFRPNERPPSFNFQKACWDGFASYFDSHCPSAEEYSSLSLSSAAALFTSLILSAAKSPIPFGRIKRPPKAWWFAEVEQAVSERRKAFAAAHRSDDDRQAYISASRRALSVIAKAKAEAWQATCSSLSPRSNPKSVHSLLRSIAGSPSSSSSSPNFPNCSSPRESASVYAAYLRSHFSVSQQKALRSRARGYLTELRRATCPVESHSSFCSPFSPVEILAAASNLTPSTVTGPDKVAYPMLKHLPRSGMDLLLYIFNLSWSSHSFHLEDIFHYSHPQDGKTSRLSSFLPASLSPPAYQSCLKPSFYPVYSSFWNLISFSLPARPVSALVALHSIKFCSFLSPFRMGLTNPGQVLGQFSLLSISPKFLTLSGIPPFSINSFRLASFLALLVGLNLFFLIGALVWFIKITKVVPFESVEMFRKDPFLALHFSLSSLMIFWHLCLLPSAALFTLTIWPFGPLPPRSPLWWRPHKELCFDSSAGLSTGVFLSIRANVRPPSPHQSNLQPNLLLLGSRLRFIPTPTFLGVTFDRTLSFAKHVSLLKAKFFPRLKALRCVSASSWGPSKESLSLLYKAFLRPLLTSPSPGWFPFLSAINLTKLERLHRAASRAITGCLSSSPIPLLLTKASLPPLRVTLTHFTLLSYERALRLPTSFFLFQDWPD